MRLTSLALAAAGLAGLANSAQAQNLHFNEIYASMTGADTAEFIELIGTPGMNLNNFVVIMIEGDGGGAGTLDRVWDLSGHTVPTDGYFVMGNIATVPNTDYDLAQGPHNGGTQDNIENGSETFYLLYVPSVLDIQDLQTALYNTQCDPDGNFQTFVTDLPNSFQVIENVAMIGVNATANIAYDCAAEIGPDGTFFPSGIVRWGDYPNDFCGDQFPDFATPGGPDQTPGAPNVAGACTLLVPLTAGCGGGTTGVGTPFCSPMDVNSTGASTTLTGSMGAVSGSGLHLEVTQGPPTQFGYFLIGTGSADPGTQVGGGRLCLALTAGNQLGRYNIVGGSMNSIGLFNASGVLENLVSTSSTGTGFDVPSTIPSIGGTIMAGDTWHFQVWHREVGSSNFSNGLSVTF